MGKKSKRKKRAARSRKKAGPAKKAAKDTRPAKPKAKEKPTPERSTRPEAKTTRGAPRTLAARGRFSRALTSGLVGLGFGGLIGLGLAYVITRYSGIITPDLVEKGHDKILFWAIVAMGAVPVFVFQFYRTFRAL